MMERKEALELMKQKVKNKNLQNHCLAVESVMKALAERFNEDVELWGLAGLLHDIDYDKTKDDPAKHSIIGAEMLAEKDLPEELIYAVKVHNDYHGLPRKTLMDKALFASDPLTGLIVAAALIKPDKKLEAIDADFLVNRFKEKSFARGANRETISTCSELDLELKEFMAIGLKAMQDISDELGL
jgi:hypothetical protein